MIYDVGYQLKNRVGYGFGLATSFEWPSVDTETTVLAPGMALAIKPGKVPNMLVLDENPLEDISNTWHIASVVKRGEYFDPNRLDQILDHEKIYLKKRMKSFTPNIRRNLK